MHDLYDLFAVRTSEVTCQASSTPPPAPPTPGTVYTASIETIDNDRAGVLLGALNI
ncbi:hypothetical protein [Streptomyces sp. NPDC057403]|uniref:hypothetical protein n=1 Tax=Streptomyces sp. NPDC057403 TaxID=3346119 RepID=UPI0036AE01B1